MEILRNISLTHNVKMSRNGGWWNALVFSRVSVLKIDRLCMVMSFCGSILADCFVLTPHNNQLRHCQRNTHSSHFSWRSILLLLFPSTLLLLLFSFSLCSSLEDWFQIRRSYFLWKPLCQQAEVFFFFFWMSKYFAMAADDRQVQKFDTKV